MQKGVTKWYSLSTDLVHAHAKHLLSHCLNSDRDPL